MSRDVQVWALGHDGADDLFLPDLGDYTITPIAGDVGSVSIDYPRDGRRFAALRALIVDDRPVELEVRTDGTSANALGALLYTAAGDDIKTGAVWTFTGNTLEVLMRRARVPYNADPAQGGNEKGETTFSANAGVVMRTLMQRAQARGALLDIDATSFTTTTDSNGQPWTATAVIVLTPGRTYADILATTLHANELCEWEVTRDRQLRLYNPGTRGVDRSVAGPAQLTLEHGRDLEDAPIRHDVTSVITHLTGAGKDGLYTTAANPTALARLGERVEGYQSFGEVADLGTLQTVTQLAATAAGDGLSEHTHGLILESEGHPIPGRDFDLSDWLLAGVNGVTARRRVVRYSLSRKGREVKAAVTLGDLINARAVRTQRAIDALTNGSTVVGTSVPPPGEEDQLPPAAPEGVVVDSEAQPTRELVPRSAVVAQWIPVTTNVDGTATDDVAGYIVQWRYLDPDLVTNWRQLAQVDGTTANWSDVNAGEPIEVRVLAVDRDGLQSAWSDPSGFHTTETDATPPPVPSALVVTEFLGTLTGEWDGRGAEGEPMPADFDEADMYRGTSNVFADAVLVESLAGPGARNFTDLEIGTTYYFWLVTVDRTGNTSEPSAVASGSPALIGFGNIAFSQVGNLVEDGSFELAGSRATHAARSHPAWGFIEGGAEHGDWHARATATTGSGVRDLALSPRVPIVPGQRLAYRFALRGTGVNGDLLARIRFHRGDGTSTDLTLTYTPTDATGVWLAKEVPNYTAPAGAVSFEVIVALGTNCTTGTWDLDRVEVREMIGTLLVQDAAITNAKIANLDVGKLTAGTLNVVVNNAGTVQSGPVVTGVARYKLDATGLTFFDTAGNAAIHLDRATASAMLTGTVQTGRTGRRAVLSGTGNDLRFYPQTGETRFARLHSYIPGNYPNDIALEMSAIDSDTIDDYARMYLLPDRAGLVVSPQGQQASSKSGVVVTPDSVTAELNNVSSTGTESRNGGYMLLLRDGAFLGMRRSGVDGFVSMTNLGDVFLNASSGRQVFVNNTDLNVTQGRVNARRFSTGGNGANLEARSGRDIFFYWVNGTLNIGDSESNGALISPLKSFVIDHPVKPDRHLVHVTTESPHAGVEYWGTATVEDGTTVVELPDYFEPLTQAEGRIVQLTVLAEDNPADREKLPRRTPRRERPSAARPERPGRYRVNLVKQLPTPEPSWGAPAILQATYPRDGRFTIHATGGAPTLRVMWLVKAIRADVEQFDVEPRRSAGQVRGDGPYTYFVPQDEPARRTGTVR